MEESVRDEFRAEYEIRGREGFETLREKLIMEGKNLPERIRKLVADKSRCYNALYNKIKDEPSLRKNTEAYKRANEGIGGNEGIQITLFK